VNVTSDYTVDHNAIGLCNRRLHKPEETGMTTERSWFDGWRLFWLMTLALTALCAAIAGMRGFEVDGVRTVIRFTARTSLMFFCLAFSAAALARLWPNAFTRWQRRNRRYLGVTFASSHALHAVAIVAFARMDPAGFAGATSLASYVFGGIGYTLILLVTATSFDATAATLGPRAWRALHLVGGYYLLLQFTVSFGKRIPDMPLYALFLIPLVAVFVLRMVAMAARATPRTIEAS
jgi:DMSO/TMAO reductase YedYZ heme-binding membrane subunit